MGNRATNLDAIWVSIKGERNHIKFPRCVPVMHWRETHPSESIPFLKAFAIWLLWHQTRTRYSSLHSHSTLTSSRIKQQKREEKNCQIYWSNARRRIEMPKNSYSVLLKDGERERKTERGKIALHKLYERNSDATFFSFAFKSSSSILQLVSPMRVCACVCIRNKKTLLSLESGILLCLCITSMRANTQ